MKTITPKSPRENYLHISTFHAFCSLLPNNDIGEPLLGNAALAAEMGYPREFSTPGLEGFGVAGVDLTIDAKNNDLVCQEVNGPNFAGSSSLTRNCKHRVDLEAANAHHNMRIMGLLTPDGELKEPVVILGAHQHHAQVRTLSEYIPRQDFLAALLEDMFPKAAVARRFFGAAPDAEGITVASGDVPSIVAGLTLHNGEFRYYGHRVVLITNPNIISELKRVGKLTRELTGDELQVFHGGRITPVFHDRCLQQELFTGTGIRPLKCFRAMSIDELFTKTKEFIANIGPVVLKPNGTSGGAGIIVVTPEMSDDEIMRRIDHLVERCRDKYSANADAFIFPLTGFEFVQSRPLPLDDGGHAWDLRIAVYWQPDMAWAFPVSLRSCPAAFDLKTFADDYHARDQWVSNVSGRNTTHLKSGMDTQALNSAGMTAENLERAFRGAVAWVQKASDRACRGGGADGEVYEDACEVLTSDWEYGKA